MSEPSPHGPVRLTPEQLEREIRVCDRFEADWRAGGQPQIEAFLSEVPGPERPSLLHKLIGLEVELRADRGERPTPEVYRDRFPDHTALIASVFDEMSTPGGSGGERPDASWVSPAVTSSSKGVRFRILRPHAERGLGVVYFAVDEELNREVALKEIRASFAHDPQYRSRFLAEAEITGRLEHPGIVPIYGLGRMALS